MIDAPERQQGVSPDIRRQVLDLRRRHSFREVARMAGLPLGTVKAICSRAGVFRDNQAHRSLFSRPPIRESNETLPDAPKLPPQQRETGDPELDAVLWLRAAIDTGSPPLIDRAMEASTRIKTPLKTLEDRYVAFLRETQHGNLFATLATVGFDDLEGLAAKAIERSRRQTEARARFGDALFDPTPAELFCVEVLAGLEAGGPQHDFDGAEVAARFKDRPELMPQTLADCLHELRFWSDLYRLRSAVCRDGSDPVAEGKLCEHRATQEVRMLKECPPGTREVFAMERSVGGGFLMPSGRWIGPVAPRKDESPQRFRSQQDQAAHEDLLRRIPDAR